MATRYGCIGSRFAPKARLSLLAAILLAPCLLGSSTGAIAADTTPLRFCADPKNLPFSNDDAANPGVYVDIGGLIAKTLGRDMTTVWSYTYYGKRNIRTTLLAGLCDAAVGLPADDDFMGRRIIDSKPLLKLGYALVSPVGKPVKRLAELKGARVGVQFESGPQNYLATRNDVEAVTFLDPTDAMRALAAGKVDAAFIWGPVAGFMNKTMYGGAYSVIPVAGPGMQWQAAVGFSSKNGALRDAVDGVLPGLAEPINSLLEKYGFPMGAPIVLDSLVAPANRQTAAQSGTAAGAALAGNDQPNAVILVDAQPAKTAAAAVEQGRELFNGTCAHCHGPNAVQSERRIDLRLLHHRYGDEMDKVFMTTVTKGRPTKGMPSWAGIFSDQQFANILSYLHTVQTADP